MSPRRHDPTRIYTVAPLGMMVSYVLLAIKGALFGSWFQIAACVVGILTAACTGYLMNVLREQIKAADRSRVEDAYKIQGLEAQLRRAQTWHK